MSSAFPLFFVNSFFVLKIIFLKSGSGGGCVSYYFETGLSGLNCKVVVFRLLPKCSRTLAICHFERKVCIFSLIGLVIFQIFISGFS